MRISLLTALATLALGSPVAWAQTAEEALVTFFSHGSQWTSGLPGVDRDIYSGNIYDGSEGLFQFRDGFFIHNNRFLTMRLKPGVHVFGASFGKQAVDGETLTLDLKAGDHYWVWAHGVTRGVPGIFTTAHGRLDQTTCTEAQAGMENAHPLKEKALFRALRPGRADLVVDEPDFPACS